MTNRKQLQEVSDGLKLMLEKVHAEYREGARKVRWNDGLLYVCGVGECSPLALTAGYAFETFLVWPVVARPVEVFQSYGHSLMAPKSVLLIISTKGEHPEAQELARNVQKRGGSVAILTNDVETELAKSVNQTFYVPIAGQAEIPAVNVGMYAALNLLAFEVSRALKKPHPSWDSIERDFDQLPEKLDWVFTQLVSVVRSLAAQLAKSARLTIVGGGFFEYSAILLSQRLRDLPDLTVAGLEAADFLRSHSHYARRGDTVLLLSGSQSKMKKVLHQCAKQAKANGAQVLSLTDGNDRELGELSDLGLLLPSLMEAQGSTLTLFMAEWLGMETQIAATSSR